MPSFCILFAIALFTQGSLGSEITNSEGIDLSGIPIALLRDRKLSNKLNPQRSEPSKVRQSRSIMPSYVNSNNAFNSNGASNLPYNINAVNGNIMTSSANNKNVVPNNNAANPANLNLGSSCGTDNVNSLNLGSVNLANLLANSNLNTGNIGLINLRPSGNVGNMINANAGNIKTDSNSQLEANSLSMTPLNLGPLTITQSPGIQGFSISVVSDNLEVGGLVNVKGEMPFLGTINVKGKLPTEGLATVVSNNNCLENINGGV